MKGNTKMKKAIVLMMVVGMFGCAEVVIDSSSDGTGGELGGSGGSSSTSSTETGGVVETTSSTETFTDTPTATTTDTQTITDTKTKQCEAGTSLCFGACCDEVTAPKYCISNENGYCCPDAMFCIPKS